MTGSLPQIGAGPALGWWQFVEAMNAIHANPALAADIPAALAAAECEAGLHTTAAS